MKYVSDKQLSEHFGVHRITIWRWAKSDPSFPKPIQLTPGCTRWKLAEVEAWAAAREVAA